MKTTKETVFEYIQKELMTNPDFKDGMSTNVVATHFQLQRSNVSTLLNALVKEGQLEKSSTRPVLYFLPQKSDKDSNDMGKNMIGANGSLANAVQVAKAAILYPNRSLNVLVTAKPGCGTTHFALAMYLYGKHAGIFKNANVMFKVNCRHYKDNIDKLNDILFKPDDMENSLFARARGGMLFIDNVDLLDATGRSKLSTFLESGMVYSENRMEFIDCHNTFVTVSCNPAGYPELSQKMSMVVTLPDLASRPIKEKLDLINYFFTIEANNAKRNIEVKREIIEALLLTDFAMNVKGLEVEIKRACATSCVRVMDSTDSNIEVTMHDFSNEVQKSLLRMRIQTTNFSELLGTQSLFIYDSQVSYQTLSLGDSREMYEQMRLQYAELTKHGIDKDTIHNIINNHVSNLFKRYNYYRSYNTAYDIEQLSKIVDEKIIHMVSKIIQAYKNELHREIPSQVFYGLCLHMNSLLNVQLDHSRVDDSQVVRIIQDYPKEYALSIELAQMFQEVFHIELPTEEIVIITMFLIKDEEEPKGHPVLLYIFHGKGVASSLAEVTKTLTHASNTYAYDLHLEKGSKEALEEIKELIQKIDEGQGIIVIYDMGSIKTMLDTISEEINVKIRYIYFPITLVGLDVSRKCAQEEDLDYVYHTTMVEMKNLLNLSDSRKEIIITLCHTGEGGAYQLKQYIDQYSNLGIKTVPLAISKREELIQQVMEYRKIYHIHCFVGTYDPKLLGIPFVSMTKVFENKPEDVDKILMFEPIQSKQLDYAAVYGFLEEQFKCISIAKLKSVLPSIIDQFEIIYSLNADQKVGLFVHIASLLENLKQGVRPSLDKKTDEILLKYSDDVKTVSKILKPLEKTFKVIIDDNQIATIIRIINKI
ncbi:MAG: PRD domain-containing protein [Erysipelotrichaceae bacterium]|nr:PRD domain-containing protein [Erysipelotrichaceae bacterium]